MARCLIDVHDGAGKFCGILLAAGRSLRFGSDKLLCPLPNGTPIALASAMVMYAALPRVVAVVRDDSSALREMLESNGVETVLASSSGEGMGKSLAAGICATSNAAGWIVGLADMPYVSPSTVGAVLAALEGGSPLAAPIFQGRRGHPVGFARRFIVTLSTLQGDEGARQLLREHHDEITLIECADSGTICDIDRASDLRK